MYVGMWGVAAILLLVAVALTGFMLAIFRLCDYATNWTRKHILNTDAHATD